MQFRTARNFRKGLPMATDINTLLGQRLRRRRRVLGLTQSQLAEQVGIRFQQIQKYECAANKISAERLWQLAEALESPISYFYDGLQDEEQEDEEKRVPRREMLELAEHFSQLPDDQRERVLGFAKSVHLERNLI